MNSKYLEQVLRASLTVDTATIHISYNKKSQQLNFTPVDFNLGLIPKVKFNSRHTDFVDTILNTLLPNLFISKGYEFITLELNNRGTLTAAVDTNTDTDLIVMHTGYNINGELVVVNATVGYQLTTFEKALDLIPKSNLFKRYIGKSNLASSPLRQQCALNSAYQSLYDITLTRFNQKDFFHTDYKPTYISSGDNVNQLIYEVIFPLFDTIKSTSLTVKFREMNRGVAFNILEDGYEEILASGLIDRGEVKYLEVTAY